MQLWDEKTKVSKIPKVSSSHCPSIHHKASSSFCSDIRKTQGVQQFSPAMNSCSAQTLEVTMEAGMVMDVMVVVMMEEIVMAIMVVPVAKW